MEVLRVQTMSVFSKHIVDVNTEMSIGVAVKEMLLRCVGGPVLKNCTIN
jgi:hypothetical protein